MKLFAIVFLVTFFGSFPFMDEPVHTPTYVGLPIAGQSFHIAGQEAVETEIQLVLRAQKTCEVGELVRFDASESTVEGLTWQILPKTNDFEVIESGKRAFFASRTPGEYLIIIAGAKDDVPYLKHWTIRVRGEITPPGPKTIDTKISDWLTLVPESETKVANAKAMALVFRQTAAKEDVDVENLLEATAIANVGILGDDLEVWKPFLVALGEELDTYIESGQLGTREQFQGVWVKIAEGLERAVEEPE